ncbi:hypothetical protein GCM10027605_56590 [Micromonospora zhanjiangensis]
MDQDLPPPPGRSRRGALNGQQTRNGPDRSVRAVFRSAQPAAFAFLAAGASFPAYQGRGLAGEGAANGRPSHLLAVLQCLLQGLSVRVAGGAALPWRR